MNPTHETDVVIIGAGPAGLFAVFQCGMMKLRCHVLDALVFPGGQCAALYPEKPIYDIPGYPSILAQDLVEKLEQQAAPFSPVYHLGEQVVKVESGVQSSEFGKDNPELRTPNSDHFLISTSAGTTIACKAILIAAGCGAFGPNRPPLSGLEEYEKSGAVAYLVRRREDYRGRRVVIAGGGDSAVDWAISLVEVAAHVYVVHRRDKFRAAPESEEKLKALAGAGKIELVIPYQLSGLEGAGGALSAVLVKDLDGNEKKLPADTLLPFYGLAMELGPIAQWGLNLHMKHIEVNPATLETNIPGIYAIGDIATYKNKLKLIACGFAEAAMAAHAIYPRVHPDKAYHFEYSTTSGVPGA